MLKAVLHLLPEILHRLVDPRPLYHQGLLGQIVKQGGGGLEKQGQIVLDSTGGMAGADLPIDQALLGVSGEAGPVAVTKAGDGLTGQGELPGRQQFHPLHLVDGALAVRVEGADGIHILVQQIDPVGQFRAHGKQIHQGAPHRKLAMFGDLGDITVTGRLQPGAKII